MQLLYLTGYIMILQGGAFIVRKGILDPVAFYCILYLPIKTWYLYHCTKIKYLCKGNINNAH